MKQVANYASMLEVALSEAQLGLAEGGIPVGAAIFDQSGRLIGKGHNRRVVTAQVDVRDYAALKSAVESGVEQLGRLDIIVANAGIGNGGNKLHKIHENIWQDMIDINLTGVWKTVKAGVPHLIDGGRGGSIVLTGSVGAMKALAHTGHYVAAKHGVVGLMRAFAVELGQHKIRVNSVHPTQVNTPMTMNDVTFRLFRPDLENPGPEDFAPFSQMMHTLPVPWVEPPISATRSCSSPLTNLVMSPAFRFP